MKIRMRQMVVGAALIGAAAAGGALAASALTPGASDTTVATETTQTTEVIDLNGTTTGSTGTSGTQADDSDVDVDPSKGGHRFNGITEAVLTGTTATRVKAAAEAAVPGGTVERVENDAEGNAPYEAHVVKPDGSHVTVYVNADFTVQSVEADQGRGDHHGRRGHSEAHDDDHEDDAPTSGQNA